MVESIVFLNYLYTRAELSGVKLGLCYVFVNIRLKTEVCMNVRV